MTSGVLFTAYLAIVNAVRARRRRKRSVRERTLL